jgi:hypothetical protein
MLRDKERAEKIRVAVRYLLDRNAMQRGHQARLARHFGISRQRVNQIVDEERVRTVVRYLLRHGALQHVHQRRIALHYGISQQRAECIVMEERLRARRLAAAPPPQPLDPPASPRVARLPQAG